MNYKFVTMFTKNYAIKLAFILFISTSVWHINAQEQEEQSYTSYQAKVLGRDTNEALVFAAVQLEDTNISTITNSEGEFSIKVPAKYQDKKLIISMLGYKTKEVKLTALNKKRNKIYLDLSVVKLSEIVYNLPKTAKDLVADMYNKRHTNYAGEPLFMTAFYRETIKKRNKNASLAEAVVNILKQPKSNNKKDKISLFKSRKNTDYSRLDTIALKLQGGPFNALYLDVLKYPDYVFDDIDDYNFSFAPSTQIDNRMVHVVNFKRKPEVDAIIYFGKLYIDAYSHALVSAVYKMDVSDKERTSRIFVKKKPKDVFVYPTSISYRVDYREKNNKWYYGYSSAQLEFKVKRKGKLFNARYAISSEMAITDRRLNMSKKDLDKKFQIKPNIIISDEASGFSDPEFWGPYNVIEPDKSIETAIKKIQKKLVE